MRHIPEIGDLLRKSRIKLGLPMKTVAAYLGLSPKYMSDVECGRRPPPKYDVLLKLGMYLGINEKDLMWSAARYFLDLKTDNKKGNDND